MTNAYMYCTKMRPTNCNCDSVYDELHFEWMHSGDCAARGRETYPIVDRDANERAKVLHLVSTGQSYRVAPRLLKKYVQKEI